MNNDEMNKLSDALELSESQRLALYSYSERQAKESTNTRTKERIKQLRKA